METSVFVFSKWRQAVIAQVTRVCFVLVQATNYVLSHQEEDSAGEIETKLIKVSFASP